MPRTSPFTGLDRGPSAAAVTVEVGRPRAAALGCFGLTTVFLAVLAVAAFSYAAGAVVAGTRPSGSLRVVAIVLGLVFLAMVAGLVATTVRAVRARQGLAVDERGVWWRDGAVLVELPWSDVAAARLERPARVRGARSSAPITPALQLFLPSVETLRGYPSLVDKVTSGEPLRPDLPELRFTFRLPDAEIGSAIAGAVERFAPSQWESGGEQAQA